MIVASGVFCSQILLLYTQRKRCLLLVVVTSIQLGAKTMHQVPGHSRLRFHLYKYRVKTDMLSGANFKQPTNYFRLG